MGGIYETERPAPSALGKRVAAYARVSLETDKLLRKLTTFCRE